ncbi:MAG: DUF433 domain-containing protein [Chthoniobacterales bacterium]|nr:DUF433 domain-containing protein [Chthoniobacterales bacterium]
MRATSSVVKIDPEIMSGAARFAGTRVPIQNLIDYLEGGDSIKEFLEDFPSVARRSTTVTTTCCRRSSAASDSRM